MTLRYAIGRGIGSFLRMFAYLGKVKDMVESIDAESLPVSKQPTTILH